MQFERHALFALATAAALVAGAPAVSASGTKSFEDAQRGFRVRIGEKYEQVPSKLTSENAHVVANWYADAAKFSGGGAPEFQILWFATPKAATITPGSKDKPAPGSSADPPATPEEMAERMRDRMRPKSVNDAFDQLFQRAGPALGGSVAKCEDIWKNAQKVSTRTPKLEALWSEVNDPDDRKKDKKQKGGARRGGEYYAFIARLALDRPGETIEVGFLGICPWEYVKDGKKVFLDVVKSFEDLAKIATDSRNLEAQKDANEYDPEAFRARVRSRLAKGWVALDTPHYVIVYPKADVDAGLIRKIADQMEALRAQVYEVLFPPDKPVTALSQIRVCKDPEQYRGYGGPAGSAGYWASSELELVFYEDRNAKDDSLRVLYHEGFHQYIHYSVGEMDPHSWFNEGHGDYFAGFNYNPGSGKFVRDKFSWRTDLARDCKRKKILPPLWDWLHWTQSQYYGNNNLKIGPGQNYELGWDLIYFLRSTKKKEYQGILDRYFATLKGYVTKARVALEEDARLAREEAEKRANEPPAPPADPAAPPTDTKPPEGPVPPPAPPADGPPAPPPVDGPPAPNPVPPGPPEDTPPAPAPEPAPPAPVPPSGETPPAPTPPVVDPPVPPKDGPEPPKDDPAPPAGDGPAPTPPAPPPGDGPAPVPPAPPTGDGPAPPPTPPVGDPPVTPPPVQPPQPPAPVKPPADPRDARYLPGGLFDRRMWLDKALEEAFKGVDMKQLEKDWLDSN